MAKSAFGELALTVTRKIVKQYDLYHIYIAMEMCYNSQHHEQRRMKMGAMMHCTLSTLMGKKRVTIQEVHNQTGLSRNTIANLYYDRATRVDYETVAKLCTYFQCNVGDIFDFAEKETTKWGN